MNNKISAVLFFDRHLSQAIKQHYYRYGKLLKETVLSNKL